MKKAITGVRAEDGKLYVTGTVLGMHNLGWTHIVDMELMTQALDPGLYLVHVLTQALMEDNNGNATCAG